MFNFGMTNRLKLKFHFHYCLDESHINLWRYFIKLLSYLMVEFDVTPYKSAFFSKISNVEACQVVNQAKIALTLVQN